MKKFILCILSIFILNFENAFAASEIIFSEIAWMGTNTSANDEWIELYNNSDRQIDLSGWSIKSLYGSLMIELSGIISAGEYFILERTDDTTLSLTADLIYSGNLSNNGEELVLLDQNLYEVDHTPAGAWPAGNNAEKKSMERVDYCTNGLEAANWSTFSGSGENVNFVDDASSTRILGTPGYHNSGSSMHTCQSDIEIDSEESEIDNSQENVSEDGEFFNSDNEYDGGDLQDSEDAQEEIVENNESAIEEAVLLDDTELDENNEASENGNETTDTSETTGADDNSDESLDAEVNQEIQDSESQDNSDLELNFDDIICAFESPLKIWEFLPNPDGDDSVAEWIEFKNTSDVEINLENWQVADVAGARTVFKFPPGAVVSPGSYLVLKRHSEDENMATGIFLNNSNEGVELRSLDGNCDKVLFSGSAPSGKSYAVNDSFAWEWTLELTPGESNIISQPVIYLNSSSVNSSSEVSTTSVGSELVSIPAKYSSIQVSQAKFIIQEISISDPDKDYVKVQFCPNCNSGLSLSGIRIGTDNTDYEIPSGVYAQPGDMIYFHYYGEEIIYKKINSNEWHFYVEKSGLTATDENFFILDSSGSIFDAACWANQDGKWSSGEENDVKLLMSQNALSANLDLNEGVCFDSRLIEKGDLIFRNNQNDTNLMSDYVVQKISSNIVEIPKNAEETSAKSQDISFTGTLVISEIFPNPKGSDKGVEFIEFLAEGDVRLKDWNLKINDKNSSLPDDILNDGEYLVLNKVLTNSGGSIILYDPSKNPYKIEWQKVDEDQSFSLIQDEYHWTNMPTPGSANIFQSKKEELAKYVEDFDKDGIPDNFEKENYGNPEKMDTKDSQIFHEYISAIEEKTYAKHEIEEYSLKLSGQTESNSKIILIMHSKLKRFEANADAEGNWKIDINEKMEAGTHNVDLLAITPTNVRVFMKDLHNFNLENGLRDDELRKLEIVSVIPNPEGSDIGNEKLFLKNSSDDTGWIRDWHLKTEKEILEIEDRFFEPGEIQVFTKIPVLKNSGGFLELLDNNKLMIDNIQWQEAKNEYICFKNACVKANEQRSNNQIETPQENSSVIEDSFAEEKIENNEILEIHGTIESFVPPYLIIQDEEGEYSSYVFWDNQDLDIKESIFISGKEVKLLIRENYIIDFELPSQESFLSQNPIGIAELPVAGDNSSKIFISIFIFSFIALLGFFFWRLRIKVDKE